MPHYMQTKPNNPNQNSLQPKCNRTLLTQVLFNCQRRSTKGWSILNILLDWMGGVLSLLQQLVTCWQAGNWGAVTANPVKLGLAVISILMDSVFMVQHYVLFPESEAPPPALKKTYTCDPLSGCLSVVLEECRDGDGLSLSGPLRSLRSMQSARSLQGGGGGASGVRRRGAGGLGGPVAPPPCASSGAATALTRGAVARQVSVGAGHSAAATAAAAEQALAAVARETAPLSTPFGACANIAEDDGDDYVRGGGGGGGLRAPLLSGGATRAWGGGSVLVSMLSVQSVTVIVEEVDADELETY